MKNKLTITIGIPAYNEEANIGRLLSDLLVQKCERFAIDKIIIISDGSTDNTVKQVKTIKNEIIKLIDNKERCGLAKVQNEIIKNTQSDILVILQADIRLLDMLFIRKLIAPIIKNGADLVAPDVAEIEPKTFFEKILHVSTKIKNVAYRQYKDGLNVYTCRGLARAFSKKLYRKIYFRDSIGEDAYSYFYCIRNGFKYSFIKNTKVIFRLPDNFADHKKQSLRFFKSQKLLSKEFGDEIIAKSYKLPKGILIRSLAVNFIYHPVDVIAYMAVLIYLKASSFAKINIHDAWEISMSSKKI